MTTVPAASKLNTKSLEKQLHFYAPSMKKSPDAWAEEITSKSKIGDIYTFFKPAAEGAHESDKANLEFAGIALVYAEDAGFPMNYYLDELTFEMSFLEGTFSTHAQEAKDNNQSFYCLRAALREPPSKELISTLSKFAKTFGGSGDRKTDKTPDPLFAFLNIVGIEPDPETEKNPLTVSEFALSLWNPAELPGTVKVPAKLSKIYDCVEAPKKETAKAAEKPAESAKHVTQDEEAKPKAKNKAPDPFDSIGTPSTSDPFDSIVSPSTEDPFSSLVAPSNKKAKSSSGPSPFDNAPETSDPFGGPTPKKDSSAAELFDESDASSGLFAGPSSSQIEAKAKSKTPFDDEASVSDPFTEPAKQKSEPTSAKSEQASPIESKQSQETTTSSEKPPADTDIADLFSALADSTKSSDSKLKSSGVDDLFGDSSTPTKEVEPTKEEIHPEKEEGIDELFAEYKPTEASEPASAAKQETTPGKLDDIFSDTSFDDLFTAPATKSGDDALSESASTQPPPAEQAPPPPPIAEASADLLDDPFADLLSDEPPAPEKVEENAPVAPETLEEPAPAAPEKVEEPAPAAPDKVEEPAPAAPEKVEEPAPAAPEKTEEPTPAAPEKTEEPTPAAPEKVEEPAPVAPEKLEEPAPAAPDKTEEPAPVAPEKLEEPAPAAPEKVDEPAPVAAEKPEEPAPAAPDKTEEAAPAAPEKVEEPAPAAPEKTEEAAPAAPEKVEEPAPVVAEKLEEPAPAAPEKLEEPAPAAPEKVEEPAPAAPEKVEEPAPAAPEKVEEAVPVAPEKLEEPAPVAPEKVEEPVPVAQEKLEEPAPAAPEKLEEPVPVAPEKLEEPAPAAPEKLEEPVPVAPEKLEEPAPAAPEKLEEPVPVATEKLEEPAPAAPEKLEEPAPAAPEKIEEVPVAPEKLEEPAPAAPEKVEEPAPAAPEKVEEPVPVAAEKLEEPVPVAPEKLEGTAPVAPEKVEEPVPVAPEKLEEPAPLATASDDFDFLDAPILPPVSADAGTNPLTSMLLNRLGEMGYKVKLKQDEAAASLEIDEKPESSDSGVESLVPEPKQNEPAAAETPSEPLEGKDEFAEPSSATSMEKDLAPKPGKRTLSIQATLQKLEEQKQVAFAKIDSFKEVHEAACTQGLERLHPHSRLIDEDFSQQIQERKERVLESLRLSCVQAKSRLKELVEEQRKRIEAELRPAVAEIEEIRNELQIEVAFTELKHDSEQFASKYANKVVQVLDRNLGKALSELTESELQRIQTWQRDKADEQYKVFDQALEQIKQYSNSIESELQASGTSFSSKLIRLLERDTENLSLFESRLTESFVSADKERELSIQRLCDKVLAEQVMPRVSQMRNILEQRAHKLRLELVSKLDAKSQESLSEFDKVLNHNKKAMQNIDQEVDTLKTVFDADAQSQLNDMLNSLDVHLNERLSEFKELFRRAGDDERAEDTPQKRILKRVKQVRTSCLATISSYSDRQDIDSKKQADEALKQCEAQWTASSLTAIEELNAEIEAFENRRKEIRKQLQDRLEKLTQDAESMAPEFI